MPIIHQGKNLFIFTEAEDTKITIISNLEKDAAKITNQHLIKIKEFLNTQPLNNRPHTLVFAQVKFAKNLSTNLREIFDIDCIKTIDLNFNCTFNNYVDDGVIKEFSTALQNSTGTITNLFISSHNTKEAAQEISIIVSKVSSIENIGICLTDDCYDHVVTKSILKSSNIKTANLRLTTFNGNHNYESRDYKPIHLDFSTFAKLHFDITFPNDSKLKEIKFEGGKTFSHRSSSPVPSTSEAGKKRKFQEDNDQDPSSQSSSSQPSTKLNPPPNQNKFAFGD